MRLASPLSVFWLALAFGSGAALCSCRDQAASEGAAATPAADGPVKLGLLPATDAAAVERAHAPLVAEMSRVLGRPVELVVAPSYDALLASLQRGGSQLAQLSAAAFVQVRGVITGQVLAQQRLQGATEYRGAFVAKKGAFEGLTELKGKRFAFVDRHSSAGYWYPRIKLRANGFDPDTIFGKVVFAGSHDWVLEMVRAGTVDAGAVSEQTLAGVDDLEALEVTGAIPDDVIVAVGGLSQDEQERLRALLLGANESPALAAYMKERNIRAFVPHAFDEYALLDMELRLSGALMGGAAKP